MPGRPGSAEGVDRVAAFVRDNKVSRVVDTHVGSKKTAFTLENKRVHRLTAAECRRIPEGFPR